MKAARPLTRCRILITSHFLADSPEVDRRVFLEPLVGEKCQDCRETFSESHLSMHGRPVLVDMAGGNACLYLCHVCTHYYTRDRVVGMPGLKFDKLKAPLRTRDADAVCNEMTGKTSKMRLIVVVTP